MSGNGSLDESEKSGVGSDIGGIDCSFGNFARCGLVSHMCSTWVEVENWAVVGAAIAVFRTGDDTVAGIVVAVVDVVVVVGVVAVVDVVDVVAAVVDVDGGVRYGSFHRPGAC